VFVHIRLCLRFVKVLFIDTGMVGSDFDIRFQMCFASLLFVLHIWTVLALTYVVNQPDLWLILASTIPLGVFDVILLIKFIKKTVQTRRDIGEYYNIQESMVYPRRCCGDHDWCKEKEDVMLGTLCSCCVISQMGRHTADYKTYREKFSSPTGLPRHITVYVQG